MILQRSASGEGEKRVALHHHIICCYRQEMVNTTAHRFYCIRLNSVKLSTFNFVFVSMDQLHWLRAPERIQFKLAVLVYKCLHGTAPSYLADELEYTADFEALRHLRSASSLSLNVRGTRLSTVGDRAFPVAAARTWNSLPQIPNMSRHSFYILTYLLCESYISSPTHGIDFMHLQAHVM